MNPIEVESLSKRFDRVLADDDVTFAVRPGETYGLLGPNGAGKTTLVRMLTTLLAPSSGSARVAGYDVVREKQHVRASIGTVSQAETTDENLTVRENLSVHGKMYGMWGRRLSDMIERRLGQVGLWEKRGQITKTLSGGMRRRLEIARGVLHSPHILFLDEPTSGLDPQSRRAVWDMLAELKALDGSLAIVLTTHAMDEANFLCDRVAIMDRGRILCEDDPETLKKSLPTGERVELETDREIEPRDRESILALGAVNWRSPADTTVQFEARSGDGIGRLAAELVEERGYRIRHLTIAPVTLEDVFFAYTGRALRENS